MRTGKDVCLKKAGMSMVVVSMVMMGLAVLSLAMFALVNSSGKAQRGSRDQVNARYVTEAGLSIAMMDLQQGVAANQLNLGSDIQPMAFGSGSYWVSAVDIGGNLLEVTATGVENNVGSQLKLVLRDVTNGFNVWAAFGEEGVQMNSHALTDSYNSTLGSYASQAINGDHHDHSGYASSNGHVGSNANIGLHSNVFVHGNATPGVGGIVDVTNRATVSGSTLPASTPVNLPPIDVPVIPSTGDMLFDGSGVGPFQSFIPPGDHHFGIVNINMPSLTIQGPATLVLDSLTLHSNTNLWIDSSNGPVEIIVLGSFQMSSNTLISSLDHDPAALQINLLSDNIIDPDIVIDLDTVGFNSNGEIHGTVYAPNAFVQLNSNFDLYGSLMARRVQLDSNSEVHFDEALLATAAGAERIFETVAWREVPFHP